MRDPTPEEEEEALLIFDYFFPRLAFFLGVGTLAFFAATGVDSWLDVFTGCMAGLNCAVGLRHFYVW